MNALNHTEPDTADRGLHEPIDRFMVAFECRRPSMQHILDELDELQVRAVSGNGLVEVIVDADGMVIRTQVAADAAPRVELASAFTEAARAAGEAARDRRAALLAPLAEFADLASPLPDAPSSAFLGASHYQEDGADASISGLPLTPVRRAGAQSSGGSRA